LKSIDKILEEIVLENKKPLLGICLGMQLLGKSSTEDGYNKGLGFIDGEVVKFESDNLKIPHVGFNQVKTNSSLKLYEGFNGDADFYFTHSYKMTSGSDINNCNCNYGDDFVASFEVENIAGVQFHPELSQTNGIKIIKKFYNKFLMLRKRIIFTLIYSNGYFMQSRNFRLQKVGNLNWFEKNYKFQKIAFSLDELIVLNASKEVKSIEEFSKTVSELVNDVFIPIAAGGGIRSIEDAELLFNSGADKIVLNSILIEDPELIKALVLKYGSQSVVASIDYKNIDGENAVFINDGKVKIDFSLPEYIEYLQGLQIGEIYLNSIDQDGTGFGYDFETIVKLKDKINTPLIIAGGAGNENHLIEGLKMQGVSAVATANLFNFIGDGLPNARERIIQNGENIANWN